VTLGEAKTVTRRLTATLLSGALALAGLLAVTMPPAEAALPSQSQWVHDTWVAMNGSRVYVDNRVAHGGQQLAVNFDIDNTSLASHYDPGAPVPVTLRFARYADAHGVTLLFNTGRETGGGRMLKAAAELRKAGYVVEEVCGRKSGEGLTHSKQRCRSHFVAEGYTIIANVGNRSTDFVGGNYERAYRLPNYDNQLA
jgi:hypothetical protein